MSDDSATRLQIPRDDMPVFLMNDIDICFYHAPCSDGALAAFYLKKFNTKMETVKTEHHNFSGDDGKSNFANIKGKVIAFVDISPPPQMIEFISNEVGDNGAIIILDHHESQRIAYKFFFPCNGKNLPCNVFAFFDNLRSGCQIACDFVNNRLLTGNCDDQPFPSDYVGDRDINRFVCEKSRELNAGLFFGKYCTIDGYFELEKRIAKEGLEHVKNELIALGIEENQKTENLVAKIISTHEVRTVHIPKTDDAFNIICVEPEFRYLRTKLALSIITPPAKFGACACYRENFGNWRISCRSPEYNVGVLSSSLGGGGHDLAAGFTVYERKSITNQKKESIPFGAIIADTLEEAFPNYKPE